MAKVLCDWDRFAFWPRESGKVPAERGGNHCPRKTSQATSDADANPCGPCIDREVRISPFRRLDSSCPTTGFQKQQGEQPGVQNEPPGQKLSRKNIFWKKTPQNTKFKGHFSNFQTIIIRKPRQLPRNPIMNHIPDDALARQRMLLEMQGQESRPSETNEEAEEQ